VGESSKTTPYPYRPPFGVVPYRFPQESRINPALGDAPLVVLKTSIVLPRTSAAALVADAATIAANMSDAILTFGILVYLN
jgi:hypothetical protein